MSTQRTPQPGVLALGTPVHNYAEFDLRDGVDLSALLGRLGDVGLGQSTWQALNLVVGVRPSLWRRLAPDECPDGLHDFDDPVAGADGFSMPATQCDVVVWTAGGAHDIVFDSAIATTEALADIAQLRREESGWLYHEHRDLTGFIDGTENPSVATAFDIATVPAGQPGAGGTTLLLQQWSHDGPGWYGLTIAEQEEVIGRTKADSVELEHKAESSHVARTDQDRFGTILRRNMPYGSPGDHGTMFVGLCNEQRVLADMLTSMAGGADAPRDALTRFTTPVTGAYYFLPPSELLAPAHRQDDGADSDTLPGDA